MQLLTADLVKILQELDVLEQYVVKPLMCPLWDVSIKLFGSAVLEHVRLLSEISNQLQVRHCVLLNVHDEFTYLSPRSLMHYEVILRLTIYISLCDPMECYIYKFIIHILLLFQNAWLMNWSTLPRDHQTAMLLRRKMNWNVLLNLTVKKLMLIKQRFS